MIRRDDYDLSHVPARSASLTRRGLTTTAQFFLLLPLEGPLTTTHGTLVPTLLTLTIVSMISDAISQVFFSSQEDFRGCVERKSFSLATRFYRTGRGISKPDGLAVFFSFYLWKSSNFVELRLKFLYLVIESIFRILSSIHLMRSIYV